MARKQGWTKPSLSSYSGDLNQEWFVSFRFTCEVRNQRKRFQFRMNINYHKTVKQRTEEGKAVVAILISALQEGWNPFDESLDTFLRKCDEPLTKVQQMTLGNALEFSLNKKSLAHKSRQDFSGVIRFFNAAAAKVGQGTLQISEVKRKHIKEIMDQVATDRTRAIGRFTPNSFNKYLEFLSALFGELVEWEAIEYNPIAGIRRLQEIKTMPHIPPTPCERQAIRSHLVIRHPNFYRYLMVEFHAGIRPKEILGLQIKDFMKAEQKLRIKAGKDHSKTKIERFHTIPDALMPYLLELELEQHPGDWFIFSHGFLPGAIRMHRNTATAWWTKTVQKELGIKRTMYSLKHLGGMEKRNAGVDRLAVQQQYGHTSESTTMIYLQDEAQRMHEILRKNSPEF
jgi:integrase